MAREVRACCVLISQRDAGESFSAQQIQSTSLLTYREDTSSAGLPGLEKTMLHKQPNKADECQALCATGLLPLLRTAWEQWRQV